jgi:hypothetical protein
MQKWEYTEYKKKSVLIQRSSRAELLSPLARVLVDCDLRARSISFLILPPTAANATRHD